MSQHYSVGISTNLSMETKTSQHWKAKEIRKLTQVMETTMGFNVKKRGKLTYYYHGDHPVLSALVTEDLPDGDLKIYFA